MSEPIVPRDPQASTRTRRAWQTLQDIFNSLLRRGSIVRESANTWRVAVEAEEGTVIASRVFALKSSYGMWGSL